MRSFKERPLYKTTVELLSTYKKLSEVFSEAKANKVKQRPTESTHVSANEQVCGRDDEQGNYEAQVGELIADRYVVQECLGKGSFGVVVRAHDQKHQESVAVKIIKNRLQFFQQAKIETEILMKLNVFCKEEQNIVKLKKVFCWKNHLCLVFELLSFNLYELLKYTKFNGVSLNLIRKFAFQILKTLEFLASSHIGVIHCDLKPENILLKNPKRSGIKVIDFGSSCFTDHKMFKYIQSRFYRAPEVILGLHYDQAIDMWSLGAILVEMHTGLPLFDGKDEQEQLIKMTAVLNSLPQRLAEQSPKKKNFFQWDTKLRRWTLSPPGKDVSRYPKTTLEEVLGAYTGGPGGRRLGQPGHSQADYICFIDFVKKMFVYDAENRLKPTEALKHPFLSPLLNDMNSTMPLGKPMQVSPSEQINYGVPSGKGDVDRIDRELGTFSDEPMSDARAYVSGGYLAAPAPPSKTISKLTSPPGAAKRTTTTASNLRGYKQEAVADQPKHIRSSSKAIQPTVAVQPAGQYGKSIVRSRSSGIVSSSSSIKSLPPKLASQSQIIRQQAQAAASKGSDTLSNVPLASPLRLKPKIPASTSQVEVIEPAVTPTLHLLSSSSDSLSSAPSMPSSYAKAFSSCHSPSVVSPSFDTHHPQNHPQPSSVSSRKPCQLPNSVVEAARVVVPASTANGCFPRATRVDSMPNGYAHGLLFKKAATANPPTSTLRAGGSDVASSWELPPYHGGAEPPLKVSC